MRLLLTGFEPFGGETVNPSWQVARALDASPPEGVTLTTLELPVRGRISFERLLPALDSGDFDAWLGLGEAGGRSVLSVERVGINVLIDGRGAAEQPLVEDGPAAYFSRLPVAEVAAAISMGGVPAQVSNSAGTYICNEVTYVVQHHLAAVGRDLPSGFIHLPFLPAQAATKPPGTPSMALDTQVAGVRAAIECLREIVASQA
ncbi:MAG: pyroglutamyl-peptidase I [Dehalococcoidia bacterium]|nr:pyroglutamyl-peptidase I [Dehalococcoidia bacterium]